MPNPLFESAGATVVAGSLCGGPLDLTGRWPCGAVALEMPVVAARVDRGTHRGRVLDPTGAWLHLSRPGAIQPASAVLPGSECFIVSRDAVASSPGLHRLPVTSGPLPVSPVSYLEHLCLMDDLRRGVSKPPEQFESAIVALIAGVLKAAANNGAGAAKPHSRRQLDLASSARLLAAVARGERPRIAAIAARLGCSVFHLCHTFRDVEGTTIGAYHHQLRVRASARRLLEIPTTPLAALALDYGFSSHSHFTSSFRRTFGTTPSALTAARRIAS